MGFIFPQALDPTVGLSVSDACPRGVFYCRRRRGPAQAIRQPGACPATFASSLGLDDRVLGASPASYPRGSSLLLGHWEGG